MRSGEKGAGSSLYAGVKLTLTDPQNGSRPVLTLSVKHRVYGWDNWTFLVPAWRVAPLPPGSSIDDVLRVLVTQLQAVIDDKPER